MKTREMVRGEVVGEARRSDAAECGTMRRGDARSGRPPGGPSGRRTAASRDLSRALRARLAGVIAGVDAAFAAVLSDARVADAVERAGRDHEMRRAFAAERRAGATVSVAALSVAEAYGVSEERVRSVVYGKAGRVR